MNRIAKTKTQKEYKITGMPRGSTLAEPSWSAASLRSHINMRMHEQGYTQTDVEEFDKTPVRFQTTGLTSVDSLSHRVQIVIGKCACTVPFSIPRKLSVYVQTIKVGIMRHGSIVAWRSTQSQHDEHDRRIFLKERPTACSYGHPKKTYQRSHERPLALFMNVQRFARALSSYARFVHPHEVT